MDIKDIFDRVLLKSGQYILNRQKVEINIDAFRLLVEDSLAVYNKYSPHEKRYQKEIYYPRQIDFSTALHLDPEFNRVPDWIAQCNPMRYGGGSIGGILLHDTQINGSSELIDPIMAPWRYDKPLLTVSQSARHEVIAIYNHEITKKESTGVNEEIQYEVKTITPKDQALFDHIRAHFLMGIGRQRRAFTLNDLPITMDADQVVSDGLALEEKSIEAMSNYQKFYLTYG